MITEIQSLQQPGIEVFGTLTEAQLRNKLDAERGLFIAESPKVIRVALQAGYQPQALLWCLTFLMIFFVGTSYDFSLSPLLRLRWRLQMTPFSL